MANSSSSQNSVFHPVDLILAKRAGEELPPEAIAAFVHAVVQSEDRKEAPADFQLRGPLPSGSQTEQAPSSTAHDRPAHISQAQTSPAQPSQAQISRAQTAAFLMAVYFQGLSPRELGALTESMRISGATFNLKHLGGFTIDKHSTGGVGDKTSLLLAPILAAASRAAEQKNLPPLFVPMISGRSLGHTGGTLDKLETIPGFRTALSLAEIEPTLQQTRVALVGQTPELVPADRILYALRDHTGTVESPHLITSSIMSKKLAEDLRGLVLDVKVGSGAFMPTPEASRHLAELLVTTGNQAGTRTVALLTAMDEPLGRYAGNWLEVVECLDLLENRRHPLSADLLTLTLTLAGHMLHIAGLSPTPEAGATEADQLLQDGSALAAWLQIVKAQGGDTTAFQNPLQRQSAAHTTEVRSPATGFLHSMDCKAIGWAIQRLGAGRTAPGEPVSALAGLECHAKIGDRITKDQPLFTLYAEDPTLLSEPQQMIQAALHITPDPPPRLPLIREIIQASPR